MTDAAGATRTLYDGTAIPSWDAKLSFTLQKSFLIDFPISQLIGLQCSNSAFCLTVIGTTASGLVREVLYSAALPAEYPCEIDVRVTPESKRLAKELELTSGIYLNAPVPALDALAPTLIGSRLWELRETFRLEGGAARLPLYQVPFSSVFASLEISNAEFHIEISDDPMSDIETGLIVYLNADYPEFIQAVSQGGSHAERRLWGGIMRRMIISGLLIEDFLGGSDSESGTLGATVRRWTSQIWPGSTPRKLQKVLASDFSLFDAQIDSWLASFENRTRSTTSRTPKQ